MDFISEEYLKINIPLCQRSALAKFRCGVAPLAIETGRYNNTLIEERLCPMCQNDVETEFHTFMICPLYDDIRYEAFQCAIDIIPGFGIFSSNIQLNMFLANERLCRIAAKTCKDILDRRRNFLYV